MSLTQRVDKIDEGNIGTLIKAFGKNVWDNAIFVLTLANYVLEDKDSNLDELVAGFTKELQEILTDCEVEAYVKPFFSGSTKESSIPEDLSPGEEEIVPDLDLSPETEVAPNSNVPTAHDNDEAATRDPAIAAETEHSPRIAS